MVYLPPNKFNIAIRCLIMLLPLVIGTAFIGNAIMSPGKIPLGMTLLALVLIFFVITLLVIGLLGVVKLEEDTTLKQVIVSTLFKKKVFPIHEIRGYYISVYRSRYVFFSYGRILVMKGGKKIELYPGNLTRIDSIDQLMTDYSIPFYGEEKQNYPFSIIRNNAM